VSDLFWPGDERAGSLAGQLALLEAMESVEDAWLASLVEAGLAPGSARQPVSGLVGPDDLDTLARGAEAGGNPVIGLVRLLRDRLGATDAARWLHRGLTSQDVLDTALMLTVGDVLDELGRQLRRQVDVLVALVDAHRDSAMIGRTLTQQAVPITFGLKAASWLTGVLDAADSVAAVRPTLAAQLGGAAGTWAATTQLVPSTAGEPVAVAARVAALTAAQLGLPLRMPWHTNRSPITRIGDALVGCTDAWGHLAADVTTLSRPEIGELAEGAAGGSSTMPDKRNPVLSILVRRAALADPPLAATLHLAAATAVDERPDGAWHVEWATLRDLCRRTVVAGSQTTELLGALRVDAPRMAATLSAVGIPGEQQSMADLSGVPATGPYLGGTAVIIDAALARAQQFRSSHRSPAGTASEAP
jgi:3-carboxy-cis,cis-muconate cycloisomerase